MAPKKNKYWQNREKIDRIEISKMIKCKECRKNRIQDRFSNNEIQKYKEAIYQEGQKTGHLPTCNMCKPGNQNEMTCSVCDKTMAKEYFAKTHRRNPDNAKCHNCQQEYLDREPNLDDALKEEEIKEEILTGRSTIGGSALAMGSINSALPSLRTGSVAPSRSQQTRSEAGSDNTGVWINQDLDVNQGRYSSMPSSARRTGNNDTHTRAQSTTSRSTMTNNTTTESHAESWANIYPPYHPGASGFRRSGNNGSVSKATIGGSNFAKINAVKDDPRTKAEVQIAREDHRRQQEAEYDHVGDDDDDDDGSGYESDPY